MKLRILQNINNPDELEKLYRENGTAFSKSFAELSDEFNSELVRFWKIRLAPEKELAGKGLVPSDIWAVILLSLVSGVLVKLPAIFPHIQEEFFYLRDLALIVFNGIILYVFWQNRLFDRKKVLMYALPLLVLTVFVNLLPGTNSDSVNLALIHSPLLLWCLFGLAYISFEYKNTVKKIEFIRFNGEFLIMTGLLIIAGGILTGITLGLFTAIKMNIKTLYLEYVVVIGGVSAPIVSYYLTQAYPAVTSKIAPVIARVFTPLVLLTLAVYLVSLLFSKSQVLEDRDLLLLFNVMLLAVMAIIVFSVSELDKSKKRNFNVLVLLLLAMLALVINSVALAAIISRLSGGLTPNRTVVLVSNILIFVNLALIAWKLYLSYFKSQPLDSVERTVARYLSVYFAWTLIVIFVLPFVFGMR